MENIIINLVENIEKIKDKCNSSDTKQKIWLKLAMCILSPCLFVLKSKLNSAVKLILTLLTAMLMLGVIASVFPVFFLWYIWTHSNMKKAGKIIITVVIVFCVLSLYSSISKQFITSSIKPQTTTNNSVSEETTVLQNETQTNNHSDTTEETAVPVITETTNSVVTEISTEKSNSIIAQESGFIQVLDEYVFISEGEYTCIIGATKDNVNKILKHFEKTENYYIPYDENSSYTTKYTNDNLMICVDYTKDYVAKGVYVEAFDVADPLTGEGSYVHEHYDEIISLVTGGQDLHIEKDTEYANLSGIKKYPMALCIGELYE